MEQLIHDLLIQLHLGVAANSVSELINTFLSSGDKVNKDDLKNQIEACIKMHNVSVNAETVISALAEKGFIEIKGSHLHANEKLIFGSVDGTAIAKDSTKLTTDRTSIEIGEDAAMQTKGPARVVQNPDGSISFQVGRKGQ